MNFIKKHICIFVMLGIIVLTIIGAIILKSAFFPDENQAIYGNRIEGIKDYKITEETKNKIKEAMQEGSSSQKIRITGRLVYITVKLNADVSLETAKSLANKGVEVFPEEQKKYYDIQFIMANDSNQAQFPIIGYKHHTRTAISWSKDRTEK